MRRSNFICILFLILAVGFLLFPMAHYALNEEKSIEREVLYLRCVFVEKVTENKKGTKIDKIMKIEIPRKNIGIPGLIILEKNYPYMKAGYQLLGVVYNKGEEICLENPLL